MDQRQQNILLLVIGLVLVVGSWALLWPPQTRITQGLDIRGGLSVILTAEESTTTPVTAAVMERAELIVRNRVDRLGVREASIQRQGNDSLLVQIPGISNAEEALAVLGSTGQLEFVDVQSVEDTTTLAALVAGDDNVNLVDGTYEPFMTGEVVRNAAVQQNPTTGQIEVTLSMNAEGTKSWGEYTSTHVGQQVAIVLDGVVQSAPVVQSAIMDGQTAITGNFTAESAKQLKTVLETGSLPVTLVFSESRVVGPTLGQDSLRQGVFAVLIGFALVALYVLVFYRGLGLLTVGALITFASLFMGVLALLSRMGLFSLTLPGLAGIVLTIGLAADSSILILERFKEEVRMGKTIRSAANSGSRHGMLTSIDADLVTLVSATVLYFVAIGPVRGFALTLIIGITCDIVMMVLFKRPSLVLLGESVIGKAPAFWGVPKESGAMSGQQSKKGVWPVSRFNIDFLGHRNIMFAISGVLLVVSIAALVLPSFGLQFGIEFLGGTSITIADSGEVTIEQLRQAFDDAGVANANIQTTESQGVKGFIVRTEVTDPDEAAAGARAVAAAVKLPSGDFLVTTIGPGWGQNITDRALMALGLSIAAILLYISVRFEYKMSVTAVIALIHDIVITLGIYSLLGAEVTPNTVAALLTILGYSLYDTVVVFHRMKENSQHLAKQTFMQMANESINEVLVRSINTTTTSLIPVLVMLFFGGETLNDFALALAIGMLVGGYSSIGVASPIYAMWKETEPKYAALKKRYAGA